VILETPPDWPSPGFSYSSSKPNFTGNTQDTDSLQAFPEHRGGCNGKLSADTELNSQTEEIAEGPQAHS